MIETPAVSSGNRQRSTGSGNGSGKRVVAAEAYGYPALVLDLPLLDEEIDLAVGVQVDVQAGWRLERNSDGFYRWRWQLKDDFGRPLTYVTSSGKRGYRRGCKYVGKRERELPGTE